MLTPQRPRTLPDLTIWLQVLCAVTATLGVLVFLAGLPDSFVAGSPTPSLKYRFGLGFLAFGILVGLGGIGLLVAVYPRLVRTHAMAIAGKVRHPSLLGVATTWGALLCAGGVLSLALYPNWLASLMAGAFTAVVGLSVFTLAALLPAAALRFFDRVRPEG